MKVLMVNVVCGVRSTGRICTDLAEALTKEGHEVKIAYGREHVPEKYSKYAVRIGNNFSVKIDGIKTRFFDSAGFNSKAETKKFIKWVREYDPDVIHLHNLHGYYINIETLFNYLKTSGKRIIWTFHDCWPFTGHCTYFTQKNCDKWKYQCSECPQISSYPKSIIIDNSQKNYFAKKELFTNIPSMTLVTPSVWLSDLIKESFLKSYNVKVIHNGIDIGTFRRLDENEKKETRERLGIPGNKIIILAIAAIWDKRKGLDDVIKIAQMVDEKYFIIIVGQQTENVKQENNIKFINRTNSTAELVQFYNIADVVVNPTYEDNYPTVNLEAQACGTPMITYNTGGSPESVPDSNVVPVGNVDELLAEIKSAVNNKEKYCIAEIEGLDCRKTIREYLRLYERGS